MTVEELTATHIGLGYPEWQGVARGVYFVELDGRGRAELGLADAVLIRSARRLLLRLAEDNRGALEGAVHQVADHALVDVVWVLLDVVRGCDYCDGTYRMTMPDGQQVTLWLTEWDAHVLERYDSLLERVAREAA